MKREFVAVGYLDPDLVLDVNVVTGKFRLSSEDLSFSKNRPWESQVAHQPDYTGVIGIWDPLNRRMFRYEDGNPGFAPAGPQPMNEASLPAPGKLPVWGAPRVVGHGAFHRTLRFADGQKVAIRTDAHGRTAGVEWPAFGSVRLVTTVAYTGLLTSITDPFGTTRVYEHDRVGQAFELVPSAWRRGAGYRHWISPQLDDARETAWVQSRSIVRGRDLTEGLGRIAGSSFAGVSFDSPANSGYINVGLTSAARTGRVARVLERRGLLDVSSIVPAHTTRRQLTKDNDSLQRPLGPALKDCHATWGQGADTIFIDVASTITPAEVSAMDGAVRRLHSWVVIEVQGSNVCAMAS